MGKLMKCGCVSTAVDTRTKEPYCLIHDCDEIMPEENKPNLEGRIARCAECFHEARSSLDLPFFAYKPERSKDQYYCGCHGWD